MTSHHTGTPSTMKTRSSYGGPACRSAFPASSATASLASNTAASSIPAPRNIPSSTVLACRAARLGSSDLASSRTRPQVAAKAPGAASAEREAAASGDRHPRPRPAGSCH